MCHPVVDLLEGKYMRRVHGKRNLNMSESESVRIQLLPSNPSDKYPVLKDSDMFRYCDIFRWFWHVQRSPWQWCVCFNMGWWNVEVMTSLQDQGSARTTLTFGISGKDTLARRRKCALLIVSAGKGQIDLSLEPDRLCSHREATRERNRDRWRVSFLGTNQIAAVVKCEPKHGCSLAL